MLVFDSPENKFDNYEILNPCDYALFTRQLAGIVSEGLEDRVDALLVIKKGGMDMATTFFDEFNHHVEEDMRIERIIEITASSYTTIGDRGEVRLTQKPELYSNWHVLVLDDVSDHGDTLREVDKFIAETCECKITSATMYVKPHTKYAPDFFLKETERWIIYPSEARDMIKIIVEEKIPEARTLKGKKYLCEVVKGIAEQNNIISFDLPELF